MIHNYRISTISGGRHRKREELGLPLINFKNGIPSRIVGEAQEWCLDETFAVVVVHPKVEMALSLGSRFVLMTKY